MNATRFFLAITLAITTSAVGGCDRHEAPTAEGHDDHTGHEHGHDHAAHAPTNATSQPQAHEHEHEHDADGAEAHAEEVKLTSEAIAHAAIRVEPATRRVIAPTFTAPGRVAFNTEATAHVGAPIAGRVVQIDAKIGDHVKAGDALLTIHSTELGEAQSQLIMKLAEVEATVPTVALARASYERAKALYEETKGITLTELQKREADWRTAEASGLTARAAASAAQNQLRIMGMRQESIDTMLKSGTPEPRMSIVAPISGDVIDREVTLGEWVGPDKDTLLILADVSTLWVIADVPEARLSETAVNANASVLLDASAGGPISGVVSYIAPQINPATRTAAVRITMHQNADAPKLRPGMFTQVTIMSSRGSGEPVLAVPDDAIMNIDGTPAVFVPVAGEANTFAKRSVKIGERSGGWVPVIDGVSEGEPVVMSGAFLLKAELGKAGAAHEH